MESLLSFFFRMHWDHEPGRISWSAAVVEDPAAALWMFPACCGWCCAHSRAPMSRFMESRHSLLSMHWDHEVAASGGGAAVPAAVAGVSPAMDSGARRPSGRRDACPTTVRFKERSKFAAVSARSVAKERPKDEARNGAFTLIELLVAMAVIGIVAGLPLPALARARERSRQAACLSNLRQIGLAFSLSLGADDDRLADRRDLMPRH